MGRAQYSNVIASSVSQYLLYSLAYLFRIVFSKQIMADQIPRCTATVTKSFRVRVCIAAIYSLIPPFPQLYNCKVQGGSRLQIMRTFSCPQYSHSHTSLFCSLTQVPISRAEAEAHNGSPAVVGDDENGWFKYELVQREETCEGLVKPDIVFFGGMRPCALTVVIECETIHSDQLVHSALNGCIFNCSHSHCPHYRVSAQAILPPRE
jgi:hypothetical protein